MKSDECAQPISLEDNTVVASITHRYLQSEPQQSSYLVGNCSFDFYFFLVLGLSCHQEALFSFHASRRAQVFSHFAPWFTLNLKRHHMVEGLFNYSSGRL